MRQRLGMINNGQSSSLYQQQIRTLLAGKLTLAFVNFYLER